jgi:glycosyltransferase involved in cell wall biosynthesis
VSDAGGYDSIFKFQSYAENYRKSFRGLYQPFWRIVGFCLLTKRSVWDEIGGFDERFSPGNFEDDDYCLRACMAGYRNMVVGDVFIHHHGSVSCKQLDFAGILQENQRKFFEKWEPLMDRTISAVMIVKDEQEHLQSCLEQLSPIVDEIIVVDTGSTDKTKEIAAGFEKVKLFDFKWCDDFSAARNFANSKATKGWLFSIDADEVVTGLDEFRKNLRLFHVYRIVTRNYNNNPLYANNTENSGEYPQERGKRWLPSNKIRLWPNDKRIYFDYPVHEIVERSVFWLGMAVIDTPEIIVHHYGRLNDNYEYGRGDKYLKLLKKQLKSGKNDERSIEQLALQAQGVGEYTAARRYWRQLLAMKPGDSQALLNMGHCFASMGNWKKALTWSRKAWEATPDSKEAAMNTATCECMVGNRDLAEKICEDLIGKYPNYPLPQGLLNALRISKQQQTGGKRYGVIQIHTHGGERPIAGRFLRHRRNFER